MLVSCRCDERYIRNDSRAFSRVGRSRQGQWISSRLGVIEVVGDGCSSWIEFKTGVAKQLNREAPKPLLKVVRRRCERGKRRKILSDRKSMEMDHAAL